ncbi:MAG: ZIP family metal transporter [Deltaproteobacteria bacterium]|nr:ZIP family metal transporter [Deltaproteobacteria bacterium]
MSSVNIWYLFGAFLAAMIGALPPLFGRWTSRELHLFIAFGAGIFLGAIFLHILPEVATGDFGSLANAMVLTGFVGILLVERVLLAKHEQSCGAICGHGHTVIGLTAMVGLTIHNISEGLALGFGMSNPRLGFVVFLSIIAHKSVSAFSLATVFRLAGFSRKKSLLLLIIFAFTIPISALFPVLVSTDLPTSAINVASAIAAGTFLYVATCDLLPEAFHGEHQRPKTFAALISGIGIMFLLTHFHG